MDSQRKHLLFHLLMIVFAIGVFEGTSYAQLSVSVTGTTIHGGSIPTSAPAPSDLFQVRATVSPTITKVVFYRNRVAYITDITYPYRIDQGPLGQENYTYHARAYDSTGAWVDSNDYRLTFYQPRFIRMGDDTHVDTSLPGRDVDHTKEIQAAVDWLFDNGGGTLFFPCTIPPDSPAIYNIKSTIYIRENVTLQGESAEDGGPCRIYWNDVDFEPEGGCAKEGPSSLNNAAMFKIVGGTSRVRLRDLLLMSRTTGPGVTSARPLTNC